MIKILTEWHNMACDMGAKTYWMSTKKQSNLVCHPVGRSIFSVECLYPLWSFISNTFVISSMGSHLEILLQTRCHYGKSWGQPLGFENSHSNFIYESIHIYFELSTRLNSLLRALHDKIGFLFLIAKYCISIVS